MAKVRVPLYQKGGSVAVETDATIGAVVGATLWLQDGTLVTYEMLFGAEEPADEFEFTYWKLIQEVPPNVQALAKATGTGLFAVTGDKTGAMRAIEVEDGELTVENADGVDGNPLLGLADLPDAGGGAIRKFDRDAKGRVSGTSDATTDDLPEGSTNLYFTDARADARITLQKGQPLGLATLGSDSKLDGSQLPDLAITDTFVVSSQSAMLALTAQRGDVAVRTDLNKSFILVTEPASTLGNWQDLLTPTSPVTSVFGRVGAVVAQTGDYTAAQVGAEPAFAAGTTAEYRRGDKTWRDFATDVRAAVLTGLSTATNAAISATDTVLQALGKLQAQITANASVRTSGTYTPTVTGVSNVASASGDVCNWCRVDGGFVVSGLVRVTPSAANATCVASISLPFPTNFVNNTDCGGPATGKAVGVSTYDNGQVTATGGSTTLAVNFYPGTTNQYTLRFSVVVPIQ